MKRSRPVTYTPVSQVALDAAADGYIPTALAFFLIDQGKRVYDKWVGNISAADQRILFGSYIGKGRIVIDGERETVHHLIRICFGQDAEIDYTSSWANIRNNPRRSNGKVITYPTAGL